MKLHLRPFFPALLILLAACTQVQPVAPTDRPCAAVQEGIRRFEAWETDPASVPVAFVYNKREYTGLGGLELLAQDVRTTQAGRTMTARFRLDDNMEVLVEAALNGEFGETEYTVWFENKGTTPSAELTGLRSIVTTFTGADPELRGCLGDHVNRYADYVTPLRDTTVSFLSTKGTASYGHPYAFAVPLNRKLMEYPGEKLSGWVMVDYASAGLAEHIYGANFD